MYLITTDATSTAPRFRMPVLCPEQASGALVKGRFVASFIGATLGVRAWSPPD